MKCSKRFDESFAGHNMRIDRECGDDTNEFESKNGGKSCKITLLMNYGKRKLFFKYKRSLREFHKNVKNEIFAI